MRSPILASKQDALLYDWWLRDGMINTDRQVDWAWRQMMIKTCDPEYWAEMETTRIVNAEDIGQEYINLN